ncbi:MAG: DUF4173 domain-containing protein [Clostridia bacterium]|nr:DUF4173 domain-containing protein [Clostridia bacterium]
MPNEALDEISVSEDGERKDASFRPAWGKWERLLMTAALTAAGCYFFCHFPFILRRNSHLPGVGLTLTQWVLSAAALTAAGKKGRLRVRNNRAGLFLLIVSLGLGACFALYGDDALRAMNLPVAVLSTAMALASLTGANPLSPLSGPGLRLGIGRFPPSFFRHFALPVRAAASLKEKGGVSRFKGVIVGIAVGLPVVAVAMSLLVSADGVFSALIHGALSSLSTLDGALPIRLLLSMLGGLCLFSFLFSLQDRPAPVREPPFPACSPVTLSTVLCMLSAVYALFVYVQFRYLFGGAEGARAAGGYAEYARSGFFELVILSLLTLLVILPCLHLGKKSRAVRCLCAVTALLTVVIVFSAFFRMRLYIRAFGLSVLRAVTLWGMAMILLALAASMAKCMLPDRKICPLLTVLALSSWLLLNCLNVDRLVARNQVRMFNDGVLAELDVSYLSSLSPSVLPALEDIRDDAARRQALSDAREQLSLAFPVSYDWSLCWLSMRGEQ